MTAQPADPLGNPQLGALIRAQIARHRLTVEGLAKTVGVNRSTMARWLSGSVCPSPANLTALEAALGVRFVDDGTGQFRAVDPAPEAAPAPQVVVLVAGTAEAMREALDRLGVPRGE